MPMRRITMIPLSLHTILKQ